MFRSDCRSTWLRNWKFVRWKSSLFRIDAFADDLNNMSGAKRAHEDFQATVFSAGRAAMAERNVIAADAGPQPSS